MDRLKHGGEHGAPVGWCSTMVALMAFVVASGNLACFGAPFFSCAVNQAMATVCFYEIALRKRV